MRKFLLPAATTVALGLVPLASAGVTLPALGVDLGDYQDAAVAGWAPYFTAFVGLSFAIMLIWMGYRFIRKALRRG